MVEWTTPAYSKTRVDRAGRQLIDPQVAGAARAEALVVVNNWRSSHAYPLNTFQVNLRYHASQVDPDGNVVTQQAGVFTSSDQHYQIVSIQRPKPGKWELDVTGSGQFLMKSLKTANIQIGQISISQAGLCQHRRARVG